MEGAERADTNWRIFSVYAITLESMKIAIVTPFGAEDRLDQFAEFILAQGLVKHGQDARLFTYRIRSNPLYVDVKKSYKGVPVWRCEQKFGFSPRLIWQILVWRPQVVILCHIRNYLSFSAYLASRLVGARVVFQVVGFLHDPFVVADRDNPLENIRPHIDLVRNFAGFIRCWMREKSFASCWENYMFHAPLIRADVRVAVTPFEQGMMRKLSGLESLVIPWGLPSEPPTIEAKQPVMSDGRVLPNDFLFYIGQVKRRKGWDTIIEALALLKAKGVRKNLIFVTSSSPEEYKEAIDLVHACGLDAQVFFMFKISNEEKHWLYQRTEATLTPSRYEGFGIPVFESWIYGKPVLGTDIPVYQDFLLDGVSGLVSTMGDAEGLARNLERLSDAALRERIVKGGREMLLKYSDKEIVRQFEELIMPPDSGASDTTRASV